MERNRLMRKLINSFRVIVLVLLIGLNTSCAQSTATLLDGTWAIDTIYYQGEDIFEEQVFTNMMSFDDDNTVGFPRIGERLSKRDLEGNWFFNSETDQITFETKSFYFNGTFDLCFKKDLEKGYIKMVLQSDDVYVEAGKALSPPIETTILPITCEPEQ